MQKKYYIFIILLLAVAIGLYSFIHFKQKQSPSIGNNLTLPDSNDPFGAPPKGVSPNCGPEERYKFDVAIGSIDYFVDFLQNDWVDFVKTNALHDRFSEFDNYKGPSDGEVNWNSVRIAAEYEHINGRTVYALEYVPEHCSTFTLKMTNDGHVSAYGCCGE